MYTHSEQINGEVCDNHACNNTASVGVVQRGATGRHCEVLWICKDCAGEDADILPAEEARQRVRDMGGANYPDF